MPTDQPTALPWAGLIPCANYTPVRPVSQPDSGHPAVTVTVFPICQCGVPYPLHDAAKSE